MMSDISEESKKMKQTEIKPADDAQATLGSFLGTELAGKVSEAPLGSTVSEDVRNSLELVHAKTGEIHEVPPTTTNAELRGMIPGERPDFFSDPALAELAAADRKELAAAKAEEARLAEIRATPRHWVIATSAGEKIPATTENLMRLLRGD